MFIYLTSRINSWPQKTQNKTKTKIQSRVSWQRIVLLFANSEAVPSLGGGKPFLCRTLILFAVPFHLLSPCSSCLCPMSWVGTWKPRREVLGALSYLNCLFPCLFSLLQSFSLICFYQVCEWLPLSSLLECPVGGMLCKKIIVLHNCPVLRDAR